MNATWLSKAPAAAPAEEAGASGRRCDREERLNFRVAPSVAMRALSSPHVQSTFRQRANPAARERAPSPPPLLDGPLPVLNFFGSSLSRNDSAADLVTLSRSRSHSHGSSPYSSPTYGAAFASRVPSWHRLDEEDAESPPAAAAAVVLSVPLPASDPSTPTADATTPPPPTADAPLPPMRPAVVAALCLAQMAHFYSMCSIFSYAGFLAADSGWVSTPDRAGYVAGLLATMLPLGRLPTSMLWGQYADAAGRRPALIGSMLGIAVGNLAFGFARSLWAALAVRFVLLGGCNGWNSVLGPICAEVGGPRSSLLLGYVFGAGGVINLIGPAVGGLAYGYWGRRPEDHPALLPSLIGAALGATWAMHDPYATLLHASPAASVAVATALVGAAVGALALVRWAVPDVPPAQLAAWHANAVASLPLSIQERLRLGDEAAVSKYRFKTRALESYAPSIASSWTVLALAGAAGLVVVGAAMLLVHKGAALGGGALKLLTFVLVAAWVCGGAQFVVYGSA